MYIENLGVIAAGAVVEGLLQVDIDTDNDGVADNDNPVDRYTFAPEESGTYAIALAALGSALDAYLQVRDADGQLLLSNDDSDGPLISANSTNAYLELTAEAGTTYQIDVSSFDYIDGDGTVDIGAYRLGIGESDGAKPDGFQYDDTNTAPMISPITLTAVEEDNAPVTLTPEQLLSGAYDAEWQYLSVSHLTLTDPDAGQLTQQVDGTYQLVLAANYHGSIELQYMVSDSIAIIANTATLNVTPVNDAPTASPVTLTAPSAETTQVTFSDSDLLSQAQDIDGDTLTVSSVTLDTADAGTLVDNQDGTYTLDLNASYNGDVQLSYTLSDGEFTLANNARLTVEGVPQTVTYIAQTQFWKDPSLSLNEVTYKAVQADQTVEEMTVSGTAQTQLEITPGVYEFSAELPTGDTTSYNSAVSAADASMAARLAVGLISPQNEYQKIAADFDGSGTISAADASMIARQAVGLVDLGGWEFTPAFSAQELIELATDQNNSNTQAHHRASTEVELQAGQIHTQEYVAVLLGDVDGSVSNYLEPLVS